MKTANHEALLELCATHDLAFDQSQPTRIGFRTSPTLIDLMLIPSDLLSAAETVDIPFSDHSLVISTLVTQVERRTGVTCESRNLRKIDIQAFRTDIANCPFERVREYADINGMWTYWHGLFMTVLD